MRSMGSRVQGLGSGKRGRIYRVEDFGVGQEELTSHRAVHTGRDGTGSSSRASATSVPGTTRHMHAMLVVGDTESGIAQHYTRSIPPPRYAGWLDTLGQYRASRSTCVYPEIKHKKPHYWYKLF
eukprot:3941028-Rhodomonas_salina.1